MRYNIVFIFSLLLILSSIFFIIYLIYQKNTIPTILSKEQYNILMDKSDLPPPLKKNDNKGYINFIQTCSRKQCAINLNTGIKRCPMGNNSVTYDTRIEACSMNFACDNPNLPYPVLSDGSTGKTKFCDENVTCRCSKVPLCPSNNLSYFNLISIPGIYKTLINIEPKLSSLENPGNLNIVLQNPNQNCKIIPSQATQIQGSCDWGQAENEPINCEDTRPYGKNTDYTFAEGPEILIGTILTGYIHTSEYSTHLGDYVVNILLSSNTIIPGSSLYLNIVTLKGSSGAHHWSKGTGFLCECFITNIEYNSPTNSGDIPATLSIFKSLRHQSDGKLVSTPISEKMPRAEIYLYSVQNKCTPQQWPTPNYKNMLMCTQGDKNICPAGYMTYIFDYKQNVNNVPNFSRNFCQYSALGDEYMNSSIDNPFSCSIGNGCNGDALELEQEQNKYFPDFDISGIKNIIIFPLSAISYSKDTLNTFTNLGNYDPNDKYRIFKNNINKGDAWSVNNVKEGSSTTYLSTATLGGYTMYVTSIENFKLPFQETAEYRVSFGTNTKTYKVTDAVRTTSYGIPHNEVVLNQPIPTNLVPGETIVKIVGVATSGIVQEIGNTVSLNNFERNPVSLAGFPLDFNFIKQFGFNGFNYNTEVGLSGANFYRLNKKINMTYPYVYKRSSGSIFNQQAINSDSLKLNSPFDKDFSMYYPVWNQDNFKQECIRCKPSLFAYCLINSGTVASTKTNLLDVVIQYSGRDFLNYEYDANDNNFVYTLIREMADTSNINTRSTSNKIYIKSTDFIIKEGDYIIDSNLELNTDFFSTKNFPKPSSCTPVPSVPGMSVCADFKIKDLLNNCGINESTNSDIIYNGKILAPENLQLYYNKGSNQYSLLKNSNTSPTNYFFGKYYNSTGTSGGIYLSPKIKVTGVKSLFTIPGITEITTDNPVTYYINTSNKPSYLQFCRKDIDPLELILIVVRNDIPTTQENLAIVDKISDGRITNIKINKGLTGLQPSFALPGPNHPPYVKIKKYIVS